MSAEDTFGMYSTMSIASLGPATFPLPKRHIRSTPSLDSFSFGTDYMTKRSSPQKPDFLMDISDIPGTRSKTLHHQRQGYTPEIFAGYNRRSDLICPNYMLKTRRHVNPLEPDYPLPSYEPAAPAEAKFIRDSFDVSDIDGAKPRPLRPRAVRNPLNIDDIDGARTLPRPRVR